MLSGAEAALAIPVQPVHKGEEVTAIQGNAKRRWLIIWTLVGCISGGRVWASEKPKLVFSPDAFRDYLEKYCRDGNDCRDGQLRKDFLSFFQGRWGFDCTHYVCHALRAGGVFIKGGEASCSEGLCIRAVELNAWLQQATARYANVQRIAVPAATQALDLCIEFTGGRNGAPLVASHVMILAGPTDGTSARVFAHENNRCGDVVVALDEVKYAFYRIEKFLPGDDGFVRMQFSHAIFAHGLRQGRGPIDDAPHFALSGFCELVVGKGLDPKLRAANDASPRFRAQLQGGLGGQDLDPAFRAALEKSPAYRQLLSDPLGATPRDEAIAAYWRMLDQPGRKRALQLLEMALIGADTPPGMQIIPAAQRAAIRSEVKKWQSTMGSQPPVEPLRRKGRNRL